MSKIIWDSQEILWDGTPIYWGTNYSELSSEAYISISAESSYTKFAYLSAESTIGISGESGAEFNQAIVSGEFGSESTIVISGESGAEFNPTSVTGELGAEATIGISGESGYTKVTFLSSESTIGISSFAGYFVGGEIDPTFRGVSPGYPDLDVSYATASIDTTSYNTATINEYMSQLVELDNQPEHNVRVGQ